MLGEILRVVKRQALAKVPPMSRPACTAIVYSVLMVWVSVAVSAKLQQMLVRSGWSEEAWPVMVEVALNLR